MLALFHQIYGQSLEALKKHSKDSGELLYAADRRQLGRAARLDEDLHVVVG